MPDIHYKDLDEILSNLPHDLTDVIYNFYKRKCDACKKNQIFCNTCKIYYCNCKVYFNCKTCNKQFKYTSFHINKTGHKLCEKCTLFNCYKCEMKLFENILQ